MSDELQEKLVSKIKKLLALSQNNTNEAEASAALLKAQRLMAENDISIDTSTPDKIEYKVEKCKHKWDMGFRKPLAHVIAKNFRCEYYLHGGAVTFMGHAFDAQVAREVFEYAYEFALRAGNQQYNKAYSMGTNTKGVFNSYVAGFIRGMGTKFDEQCVALMIVTPPDVKDKFAEMAKNWKQSKGGMRMDGIDTDAYHAGMQDGKTIMNGRRLGAK